MIAPLFVQPVVEGHRPMKSCYGLRYDVEWVASIVGRIGVLPMGM